MKRVTAIAAALALLGAGAALAAAKIETVYVRARNTPITADAVTTSRVLTRLQPGTKLKYLEQSKEAPRFHKVTTEEGVTGYVWYQNVSKTAPRSEVVIKSGKPDTIDAQAFASYGAAARGVASGPREVSKRQDKDTTIKQFTVLEDIAKKVKSNDAALKTHATKANLAAGGTP